MNRDWQQRPSEIETEKRDKCICRILKIYRIERRNKLEWLKSKYSRL